MSGSSIQIIKAFFLTLSILFNISRFSRIIASLWRPEPLLLTPNPLLSSIFNSTSSDIISLKRSTLEGTVNFIFQFSLKE